MANYDKIEKNNKNEIKCNKSTEQNLKFFKLQSSFINRFNLDACDFFYDSELKYPIYINLFSF